MAKQKRFITRAGLEKLHMQLNQQREKVSREALQYGLAAQDSVGERMDSGVCTAGAEMEVRIAGVRARLTREDIANVQVREYPSSANVQGRTGYGTLVDYLLNGRPDSMKIVCFADVDPLTYDDRTAFESPLGQALNNRKIGEEYQTDLNGKPVTIRINDVRPLSDKDLV